MNRRSTRRTAGVIDYAALNSGMDVFDPTPVQQKEKPPKKSKTNKTKYVILIYGGCSD